MNQLLSSDEPKTAFEKTRTKLVCTLEDALYWVEDRRRPALGALGAILLGSTAFVGVMNQNAINDDYVLLQQAAVEDGVHLDSIASGIRGDTVLADITIDDCRVHDSTITLVYRDGVLRIDDYTVPTTVTSTRGDASPAIHVRNVADFQSILPLSAICE